MIDMIFLPKLELFPPNNLIAMGIVVNASQIYK